MTLDAFTEMYALQQDLADGSAAQLRWCVAAFTHHLGHEAELTDLTPDTINRWLQAMKTLGTSATTRASRRRMLLTLATAAARQHRLAPIERELVARVKVVRQFPEGLSRTEAQKAITSLSSPPPKWSGWLQFAYRKLGITRAAWWRAYLLATWDSGAPADCRQLKWSDIQPNGTAYVLRGKTGKPLAWKFSPATLQAIEAIRQPERELIFQLPGSMTLFRKEAATILQQIAGLKGRSLGGLRSGAGTDAELLHGEGSGHKLLGNTPATFERHYKISRLLPAIPLAPRPLVTI